MSSDFICLLIYIFSLLLCKSRVKQVLHLGLSYTLKIFLHAYIHNMYEPQKVPDEMIESTFFALPKNSGTIRCEANRTNGVGEGVAGSQPLTFSWQDFEAYK